MYASCEWCNFVPVDPIMMILVWKCSALHALQVGCCCIHVRVHLDILIPVGKYMLLLTVENCYNLSTCHFYIFLCAFILSIMSTYFRSICIPYLQWCNPCILICPVVSASSLWSGPLALNFLSMLKLLYHVAMFARNLMMLPINPCIIWRCLVDMFCCICYILSCHASLCPIYVL